MSTPNPENALRDAGFGIERRHRSGQRRSWGGSGERDGIDGAPVPRRERVRARCGMILLAAETVRSPFTRRRVRRASSGGCAAERARRRRCRWRDSGCVPGAFSRDERAPALEGRRANSVAGRVRRHRPGGSRLDPHKARRAALGGARSRSAPWLQSGRERDCGAHPAIGSVPARRTGSGPSDVVATGIVAS